jgi:uncharacterized protein (TIGR02246 family)
MVLVLVVAGSHARGQVAGDRAAIEQFYQAWMGQAAQAGPVAYASFYASDGQLLPPNERPVTGRQAIADWMRRAQSESPYLVKPEAVGVDEIRFLEPAWVVHLGTLRGQRIPRAGGAPTPFETKYFDLLHRTADGGWQVAYRMWSDNLKP